MRDILIIGALKEIHILERSITDVTAFNLNDPPDISLIIEDDWEKLVLADAEKGAEGNYIETFGQLEAEYIESTFPGFAKVGFE